MRHCQTSLTLKYSLSTNFSFLKTILYKTFEQNYAAANQVNQRCEMSAHILFEDSHEGNDFCKVSKTTAQKPNLWRKFSTLKTCLDVSDVV